MPHPSALLSPDGRYRYTLTRPWGDDPNNFTNFANFILLNPSKADADNDDATIRRCINLSKSWGYDGFHVTNLFAFRTPYPKILKQSDDPIGADNDHHIVEIAQKSKIIILAWGNHGNFMNRDKEVLKLLGSIKPLHCLDITKEGQPKHPLMVRGDIRPIKFQYILN